MRLCAQSGVQAHPQMLAEESLLWQRPKVATDNLRSPREVLDTHCWRIGLWADKASPGSRVVGPPTDHTSGRVDVQSVDGFSGSARQRRVPDPGGM